MCKIKLHSSHIENYNYVKVTKVCQGHEIWTGWCVQWSWSLGQIYMEHARCQHLICTFMWNDWLTVILDEVHNYANSRSRSCGIVLDKLWNPLCLSIWLLYHPVGIRYSQKIFGMAIYNIVDFWYSYLPFCKFYIQQSHLPCCRYSVWPLAMR